MAEQKGGTQFTLFFIQRFKGKVLFNVPMSAHTSLNIGGSADVMAFPQDEADLKDLIQFAEAKGFQFYIIGAGTNLLVRDNGIRGIVINMTEGFNGITWLDKTKAVVGAGVKLSQLLNGCKERGLGGLEFACGIPGTVGGGVAMNAGAYGGEMKDVVDGVEIAGKKGQRGFLSKTELNFSYRRAEVPRGAVIVRAHMSFVSRTPEEISEKIKEFRERRRAAAQITSPSAGSIFKNPEGLSAGKLIEEAGFKGMRLGGAKVSEAHANYIVNEDGAKAKDVLALMAEIRDKVYAKTGVLLEPEIKVLGED